MPIELANFVVATLGLLAAGIAAWYALRAYFLKVGISIRGSYSTTTTVDCDDPFVSSVTLENMKDRALVVFGIWLDLGPGYYLEIERFDDTPLIIEPFQVVHRTYQPIQHYSGGTKRVALGHLLQRQDLRRRLLLSTPFGKYRVRAWLPRWEPVYEWVKNYATNIFYPVRYQVDGKTYGSNVAFLVRFRLSDGREEAIPLRTGDVGLRLFRNFQLTSESLSSASALEAFLLERALAGDIKCVDLSVIDLRASRREVFTDLDAPPEVPSLRSAFEYQVLGRFYTWWENRRIRRENKRALQKRSSSATKN